MKWNSEQVLLAGNKFMLQMHSRQPAVLDMSGFTYSTCKPFTKNKERIQKLKACFELVMA